jgi:positive regulator of sigma E activity
MKRLGQSPFRFVLAVLVYLLPLFRLLAPALLLVVIGLLVLSRCG